MILKDLIAEKIQTILTEMAGTPQEVRLEYARDEKFGDYACTSALDKRVRTACGFADRKPAEFAEALKQCIEEKEPGLFQDISVAGPGFLNLSINPVFLSRWVLAAQNGRLVGNFQNVSAEERRSQFSKMFGYSKTNPLRIHFEFVSANPTGPLNVVSARAAALGDSVCNLLEANGHEVFREYYVNDFGNQVDLLGKSCLLRLLEAEGIPLKFIEDRNNSIYAEGPGLPFPSEGYHGEYITDVAAAVISKHKDLKLSDSLIENARGLAKKAMDSAEYLNTSPFSDIWPDMGHRATEHFLETHKRDLQNFRIAFDNFFSERSLHEGGDVFKAREAIGREIYEEDGKIFFKSTEYGDDKDRVIIRDDGRPTYLLADIAYHNTKIERGFDRIYDIWGPDHHGYIKRLHGAMQSMEYPKDSFRVLIAQQVNLLDEGKPMVMSKRTGKFITLDTLIEEIPVDVSRYFFVMRSFEAHLDFDFSEARDTSEKNPYYYVAYAHARIRSIFQKAEELGLNSGSVTESDFASLDMTPERRRLLWLVARFPEELRDCGESLEPHRLVNYLYMLASALSKFYAPKENKIIEQDEITAGLLLAVLDAVSVCLKNGLALMGMEAPERLDRE